MTESEVQELIYAAADRNAPAGAFEVERWRMPDCFVRGVLEAVGRDDWGAWLAEHVYAPNPD
jgi:hypothetical protein